MSIDDLHKIIDRLLKLPKECEWAEFKLNFKSEEEIGKYISALSNGAFLQNEPYGYLVFGINDTTILPEGTTFRPSMFKVGNEELENWLMQRTSPRIEFQIFETIYHQKFISLFQIQAAHYQPTCFAYQDYIRVGSITRSLKDFPEKERKIWSNKPKEIFEKSIALEVESSADIIKLLDTQCYFDFVKIPYPSTRDAVIDKFISEKFIKHHHSGYAITNLGALLFAKNLQDFESLIYRAPRVIQYEGKNKLKTIKDQDWNFGYAPGFDRLIKYINALLPSNEVIGEALRETKLMYPEIAIRELVANALVHQDFSENGSSPLIEIYSDRIEITNPGIPLIPPDRFIDEYQSRNELLSSVLRRLGICEKKGSGMDKVVFNIEIYQLPAYDVRVKEKHTVTILFSHKALTAMDKNERTRACYQHCCLRYVMNEKTTNQSIRQRFKIVDSNYPIASKIIKETLLAGLIKEGEAQNQSNRSINYIPFWA